MTMKFHRKILYRTNKISKLAPAQAKTWHSNRFNSFCPGLSYQLALSSVLSRARMTVERQPSLQRSQNNLCTWRVCEKSGVMAQFSRCFILAFQKLIKRCKAVCRTWKLKKEPLLFISLSYKAKINKGMFKQGSEKWILCDGWFILVFKLHYRAGIYAPHGI